MFYTRINKEVGVENGEDTGLVDDTRSMCSKERQGVRLGRWTLLEGGVWCTIQGNGERLETRYSERLSTPEETRELNFNVRRVG